jgi:arylformamidase
VRLVDLSHSVSIHSPGWIGYPGLKMWYLQTHQSDGIVAQMIETPLHLSTHLDGEMHGISGGKDIASIPLTRLYGEGAVVDVSEVGEWGIYTPKLIESKVEIRQGDILIIHTGWWRHYVGMPEENLSRYFCRHPGPSSDMVDWVIEKELRWVGVDTGSADHPMNTSIRRKRPDLASEYERRFDVSLAEQWPEGDLFFMHHEPFRHGIVHAENVGGDIASLLDRRCTIGAFPWKFEGGESSICRIVAFVEDE